METALEAVPACGNFPEAVEGGGSFSTIALGTAIIVACSGTGALMRAITCRMGSGDGGVCKGIVG